MTQEEFSEKYMAHLNAQQKTAVQSVEGATLLLAVPGSGKTTVLVTRLGYMVYCLGIAPQSILTVTYTVAATAEMKSRFVRIFGREYAGNLEFRTINSLSANIIKHYSQTQGWGEPFQLLKDPRKMLSQIYREVTGEFETPSVLSDISTAITYIKNMMLNEAQIKELDKNIPKLSQIYESYCVKLRSQKLMDFDDQMKYALDILKSKPDILSYFQEHYRYLCVDESQDTSKIQHAIIAVLAGKYKNLFLVGDEDQSIYGFRAAYPEALMNFSREHPGAKVLLLEQNYRSSDEIVAAANAFVSKNRFRHEKKIRSTRGSGGPVEIIESENREAQYKYLAEKAKSCKTETGVLFRNNDSALPLIDLLDQGGIPYRCRQFDGSFFTHRVVSDLTDIIRFAYDPYDGEAFLRIYSKFGCPITRKAAEFACEQSRSSGNPILEELARSPELSGYARDGVNKLLALLPMIVKSSGANAVQRIRASGYGSYVNDKGLDEGKIEIMEMLGKKQPSPRDLVNRLTELQRIIDNHGNTSSGSFILSTIHSSKGLEYDQVYLLDVLDGILPPKVTPDVSSEEEVREYEEARRLYYVGMTRAKNTLHLFRCRTSESAFVGETMDSLPSEQREPESIFAAIQEDLCGLSYRHKEKGKGRVIGQNGLLLLIEYENEEESPDLLSLFELYEHRKITGVIKKPGKAKPEKRNLLKRAYSRNANAMDAEILSAKLICGTMAEHRKYGEGIVEENDGAKVTIRFKNTGKTRTFVIQIAAEQGLIRV